jgi:hypothetical protein
VAAVIGAIVDRDVGGAVGGTVVLGGDGCGSGVEIGSVAVGTAVLAGILFAGWLLDDSDWQAARIKIAATIKSWAMKIRRFRSLLWKMLTASSGKYQQKGKL